jgi:nucleoside-diphosphate-sugar epimerase
MKKDASMEQLSFEGSRVLVVGGAGFVGSNLCHYLVEQHHLEELWVVDNLLSADINNLPVDPRVHFILGSIAEGRILSRLPRDFDFVFHLACYHGNQSSIADPIADHDNNTLTSLKLFEHLKGCNGL